MRFLINRVGELIMPPSLEAALDYSIQTSAVRHRTAKSVGTSQQLCLMMEKGFWCPHTEALHRLMELCSCVPGFRKSRMVVATGKPAVFPCLALMTALFNYNDLCFTMSSCFIGTCWRLDEVCLWNDAFALWLSASHGALWRCDTEPRGFGIFSCSSERRIQRHGFSFCTPSVTVGRSSSVG